MKRSQCKRVLEQHYKVPFKRSLDLDFYNKDLMVGYNTIAFITTSTAQTFTRHTESLWRPRRKTFEENRCVRRWG